MAGCRRASQVMPPETASGMPPFDRAPPPRRGVALGRQKRHRDAYDGASTHHGLALRDAFGRCWTPWRRLAVRSPERAPVFRITSTPPELTRRIPQTIEVRDGDRKSTRL